jgi:hypothetical protein
MVLLSANVSDLSLKFRVCNYKPYGIDTKVDSNKSPLLCLICACAMLMLLSQVIKNSGKVRVFIFLSMIVNWKRHFSCTCFKVQWRVTDILFLYKTEPGVFSDLVVYLS